MSGQSLVARTEQVIGIVHPDAGLERKAALNLVNRFVADPSSPTPAEVDALDEMLQILGLKQSPGPIVAKAQRRTWTPGAYRWVRLPQGRQLHAVLWGGRRSACNTRPAEGWDWREVDTVDAASGTRCRRCELYVRDGGGRRVV